MRRGVFGVPAVLRIVFDSLRDLLADGKAEHFHTLQTCRDCGDVCGAAAGIVSRHGPFANLICHACAEACDRCDKACERYPEDNHMKACSEECRRCEKACREMLEHLGRGEERP